MSPPDPTRTDLRFCQFMVLLCGWLVVFNLVSGLARIWQEERTGAALHGLGGLIMVVALDQALKNRHHARRRHEERVNLGKDGDP